MTDEFKKGLAVGLSLQSSIVLGGGTMNYNSEEQIVGTWFNKPRYQKSFEIDVTNFGSWTTVDIGIRNIDKVVSLDYVARRNIETVIWLNAFGELTFNNSYLFAIRIDNGKLSYLVNNKSYGIDKFVGTVVYTKTTD